MVTAGFAAAQSKNSQHIETKRYVGTMTIGNYERSNVEAVVKTNGTVADVLLYDVKFARMMPVRIDVVIPMLAMLKPQRPDGNAEPQDAAIRRTYHIHAIITGDNITPLSKDKPYPKYQIRQFHGRQDAGRFAFTATIGSKPVSYKGTMVK